MQNIIPNWLLIVAIVVLITTLVSFYGFTIYKIVRTHSKRSISLQKHIEELKFHQEKQLLQTEIDIQEQTFQFISMEIHDNITQILTLAKLHLNCLEPEKDSDNIDRLYQVQRLISKALEDLNLLSKSLDSDIINTHGLNHAIDFEIEKWKKCTKAKINLNINGNCRFSNHKKELFIFRIIQEALNNIIKHARAETIDINLNNTGDDLIVSIKDNGVGFNLDKVYEKKQIGKMSGLKNMKLRADLLKGSLTIESLPEKGSVVKTIIPIKNLMENDQSSPRGRSQIIA